MTANKFIFIDIRK